MGELTFGKHLTLTKASQGKGSEARAEKIQQNQSIQKNLEELARRVYDPLKDHPTWGSKINWNNCWVFRLPGQVKNSSSNSKHLVGLAVDINCSSDADEIALYNWISTDPAWKNKGIYVLRHDPPHIHIHIDGPDGTPSSFRDAIRGKSSGRSRNVSKFPGGRGPHQNNPNSKTIVNNSHNNAFERRGFIQQKEFFGCKANDSSQSLFNTAVNTAASYANMAQSATTLTQQQAGIRTDINFYFTEQEKSLIENKAREIATLNLAPYDLLVRFLYILCYINKLEDMKYISDTIEIPELYDQAYLRDVGKIVALKNLYKIAFLSCALSAIIDRFNSQMVQAQSLVNNSNSNDILKALTAAAALGGLAGAAAAAWLDESNSTEDRVGAFLSYVLFGKRMPTTKIAKNPNLQKPSYIGKAFMCESATPMAAVDQIIPKLVAVFPKESAGAGVPAFNMMNLGSLKKGVTLLQAVSLSQLGTLTPPSSGSTLTALNQMVTNVGGVLGIASSSLATTKLDIFRPDTMIPFMSAMNTILSNLSQSTETKKTVDLANKLMTKNKDIDIAKQFTLPTSITSILGSVTSLSGMLPMVSLNTLQDGFKLAAGVSQFMVNSGGLLGNALAALREDTKIPETNNLGVAAFDPNNDEWVS